MEWDALKIMNRFFATALRIIQSRRGLARLLRTIEKSNDDEEIGQALEICDSMDDRAILLCALGKRSIGFDEKKARMAFGEVIRINRDCQSPMINYLCLYAKSNLAFLAKNWGEVTAIHVKRRNYKVDSRIRLQFPIYEAPRGVAIKPNVVSVG